MGSRAYTLEETSQVICQEALLLKMSVKLLKVIHPLQTNLLWESALMEAARRRKARGERRSLGKGIAGSKLLILK